MKTKILLSGSQILNRKNIHSLIEQETDLVVVGEAKNAPELLDLYPRVAPDVVCMDADMPGLNSIQVMQRIRANRFKVRVIFYAEQIKWSTVWAAADAGADAYICKSASIEEVLRAIRGDTDTGCYFCRQVTEKLLNSAFENTVIPTTPDWGQPAPDLLANAVRWA
jgi:DNA-binding NarL/FixJ family response regulator